MENKKFSEKVQEQLDAFDSKITYWQSYIEGAKNDIKQAQRNIEALSLAKNNYIKSFNK